MNRKNKSAPSITALYCRLSIEDGRENESMSISNQRALLRDFAVSIENQELLCRGWSHHLIHMTAVHLWQNGTLQL